MLVNIDGLVEELRAVADERDWVKHHSPKNLVMALVGEVGELASEFQWLSEEASEPGRLDPQRRQAIEDETADVLIYFAQLVDRLGIDLDSALRRKLTINRGRPWGGQPG